MRRKIHLFLLILVFSLPGQSYADEKLSLKKALQIAYDKNPSVVQARNDVRITEMQYKNAKKWENPELELEVGNLAKDLEGDSSFSTRNVESKIRITQSVEGWGKKGLKKDIVLDEFKQNKSFLKSIWLNAVREIKEQYTRSLLFLKAVEVAQENLQLHQKFLDQIKIKFDSGSAANHELSRAKLEVINARNELLSAQKEVIISKGHLNLLLGQPMTKKYVLSDSLQPETLNGSYTKLLTLALSDRADIFIQQKEVEKKSKALSLAKRERLPSYGLSLFVEREDEIYKGGVGVAFELPIWNFKGNEIKQAQLEKVKAEELLNQIKNKTALDVYTSFHKADLARKSHEISIEAMKEANEILRLTTLGYEEGEVSFLAYLENIKAYQDTKHSYFQSLSEYTIRIAELEQVIGKDYKHE